MAVKRKYPTVRKGQWVTPRRSDYRMKCCDCGLVHVMQFRLVPSWHGGGKKIQMRATKRYKTGRTTERG